jgi:hypothetical protein
MYAYFLRSTDKRKHRRSAVDVGQRQRIQLPALRLLHQPLYREGAVFETEVGMAIEKHGVSKILPEDCPWDEGGK